MGEERKVVLTDQHQHKVREVEMKVETRSKESCLLWQDGGVDGGRHGHFGGD